MPGFASGAAPALASIGASQPAHVVDSALQSSSAVAAPLVLTPAMAGASVASLTAGAGMPSAGLASPAGTHVSDAGLEAKRSSDRGRAGAGGPYQA